MTTVDIVKAIEEVMRFIENTNGNVELARSIVRCANNDQCLEKAVEIAEGIRQIVADKSNVITLTALTRILSSMIDPVTASILDIILLDFLPPIPIDFHPFANYGLTYLLMLNVVTTELENRSEVDNVEKEIRKRLSGDAVPDLLAVSMVHLGLSIYVSAHFGRITVPLISLLLGFYANRNDSLINIITVLRRTKVIGRDSEFKKILDESRYRLHGG